jgi:CYTH domain-containing protein
VIAAWTGHPHLRVIGNTEKFDTKLHHVLTEISKVLGAPAPIESERKYIVEVTGEIPGYIESEITQTYLLADPGSEVRLRKRGWQGSYEYFQTAKKQVSETEMIETERHITPHQYYMLMQQVDPERRPIKKIRKNFVWEGQYFELDTYIEPAIGLNILEIEGVTDHASIHFPPFLKILEDITGNTDYYNYTLAKK